MAYQKQIWENLPSTNTPLNADRLNHMEDGIADAWEHGGGGGGDTLPIGIILPLSTSTIPEGYLLCDGSAVSRTEYSTLFSVIGTTYGAGDGSTTFNIPDLQGKVPVGQDTNDTDFDTLGEIGGNKTHRHFNGVYAYDNKLAISNNNSEESHDTVNIFTVSGTTGFASKGTVNTFAYSTENGSSLQPYLTVKYIIKALNAQSGEIRSESLPVGTELDYDGETVPTGWEQIADTSKILWTNPSPTSTFTAQTITLSETISNFDCYEVLFAQAKLETSQGSFGRLISTGKIPIEYGTILEYAVNNRYRLTGVPNGTSYQISEGVNGGQTDNDKCVPIYVIGHNTGLF